MYCPKCSQQQVLEEMRFCSRCGFPLSKVRELVVNGGELVDTETEANVVVPSPALKGMRLGVWAMLIAFGLAVIAGVFAAIDDALAFLFLIPALVLIGGFLRLLYGHFFESRKQGTKKDTLQGQGSSATPGQLDPVAKAAELSPATVTPIEASTRRLRTAEMAQPASVTENTTRLLEDDSQ